jgi:hypothetical protein
MHAKFEFENLRERDYVGDLGVDESYNMHLKKIGCEGADWTQWSGYGPMAGCHPSNSATGQLLIFICCTAYNHKSYVYLGSTWFRSQTGYRLS